MKKQILKTCVAAALCLGGMSQALAVDSVTGSGALTVKATVTAETCQFSAMSDVDLAASTSAFPEQEGGLAGGLKEVKIKTENCPQWSKDEAKAKLEIKGTASAVADYFKLTKNLGGDVIDHAVSLTLNGEPVKPGTPIDLKESKYKDAIGDDNTITLKAGLVKLGVGAVTPADSKAALTVDIKYN